MEIRIPCKSRKAAEVYIEAAIRAGDTHRMSAVKADGGMWEVIVETDGEDTSSVTAEAVPPSPSGKA